MPEDAWYAISLDDLVWVKADSQKDAIEQARERFENMSRHDMDLSVVDIDDTEGADYS